MHATPADRVTYGTVLLAVSLLLVCSPDSLRSAAAQDPTRSGPRVTVRLETALGDIVVELDAGRAPGTTTNFLKYVDAGDYEGGRFHRTVTMGNQPDNKVLIEVVQAGVNPDKAGSALAPIALERTNATGLLHKDGTISMARGKPDTATSDFFICINDQPSLDFGGSRNPDGQGFAAFGHVISGMDVVRKIQSSAAEGQKLTPPIEIRRAVRVHP